MPIVLQTVYAKIREQTRVSRFAVHEPSLSLRQFKRLLDDSCPCNDGGFLGRTFRLEPVSARCRRWTAEIGVALQKN